MHLNTLTPNVDICVKLWNIGGIYKFSCLFLFLIFAIYVFLAMGYWTSLIYPVCYPFVAVDGYGFEINTHTDGMLGHLQEENMFHWINYFPFVKHLSLIIKQTMYHCRRSVYTRDVRGNMENTPVQDPQCPCGVAQQWHVYVWDPISRRY